MRVPAMDDPIFLDVSSKTAVPKSASAPAVSKDTVFTLPSSLSAPTAMAKTETSCSGPTPPSLETDDKGQQAFLKPVRLHESHSTGDLLDGAGESEGEKYASDLLTGKKKPHSQKLENIKFLTRAPSVDDVASILDELIIKSGGISPLPSPIQGSSPLSTSSPMPSPKFFDTKTQVTEKEKPNTEICQDAMKVLSPTSNVLTESEKKEDVAVEEERVWVEREPKVISSQTKVASSRKSILEEIPIPTLSKPRRHGTSDGGTDEGEEEQVPPVTIPASPTIKRKEMSSKTKIPSSPRAALRSSNMKTAAEKMEDNIEKSENRAERFRQEQRKLVSAIRCNAKRSNSRPGSSGEEPAGGSGEEGQSVSDEQVLTGGCALSSQTVYMQEMTLAASSSGKAGSIHEEKAKTLPGKRTIIGKTSAASMSKLSSSSSTSMKSELNCQRSQVDSTMAVGTSSPGKSGSGVKGRVTSLSSSNLSKKVTHSCVQSTTSSSSTKMGGLSRLKAAASREEDLSSSRTQASKGKAIETQPAKSLRDGRGSESGDSATSKSLTGSPITSAAKARLKQRSGEQPIPSPSPTASPGRSAKVIAKKSTHSVSSSASSPRQSASSVSSTSSPKAKPSQLPTASASPPPVSTPTSEATPSTSSSVSSSSKLSTDRTPRFV